MSDAQWIQQLHSCGFLASAFLPDDATQTLRTLVRQRRAITQDATRYIQRMQKALELMNIKLHAVISDITGKTGSAILSAIIGGERDPEKLLLLVGSRIKADRDTLRKSLQAYWREEYLFLLKQSYDTYQHLQSQKALYDLQIKRVLDTFPKKIPMPEIIPVDPAKKSKATEATSGGHKKVSPCHTRSRCDRHSGNQRDRRVGDTLGNRNRSR